MCPPPPSCLISERFLCSLWGGRIEEPDCCQPTPPGLPGGHQPLLGSMTSPVQTPQALPRHKRRCTFRKAAAETPTPMHVPCTEASPASCNPSLALSFLGTGHPNFEPYWEKRRGLLLLTNGLEMSPGSGHGGREGSRTNLSRADVLACFWCKA